MTRPIASIVIPAHDEAAVIGRCLRSILADAAPHEFEIVVVCNGCTDDTASAASAVDPTVVVIETDVAGKTHALNLGDEAASVFPRIYLDADVVVDAASIRATVHGLDEPGVLATAPALHVDTTGSTAPVRSYYEVWTRMPWVTDSLIGSGLYAVSEQGRRRFGEFPDVRAEDYWVSAQFRSDERRSIMGASFTISAAPNLRVLVQRKARILAYNRLATRLLTDAPGRAVRRGGGLLTLVRSDPRLAPDVVLYALVGLTADVIARWKVHRGSLEWVRDR